MLKHVYAECNDCATYPFEGPPNARSNTCIGFNNCLNFLTNLTPWEKKNNKEVNGKVDLLIHLLIRDPCRMGES